jgi:hypothetical protein
MGNSTLNIRDGAELTNHPTVSSAAISASSSTFYMDGGVLDPGLVQLGRDLSTSTTISLFWLAGGSFVNPQGGSGNRFDVGHGDHMAWAIYKQTGGVFSNSVGMNLSGNTTAHAQVLLEGGSYRSAALSMGGDASDGLQTLLEVTGSAGGGGPSRISIGTLSAYRHNSNTNGASVVRFVPDALGVTPVQCTTLNIGATGGRQGDLQVDLTKFHPATGGTNLILFSYGTRTGQFGSTNILLGENVISWQLDYAYQGTNVALVNITPPPVQLENRAPQDVTDVSAGLSGEITYVNPGGGALWVYYGTNDGYQVAGNWQTNFFLGSGLMANVYTAQVANLSADTRYYYRFFVTHGSTSVWAETSETFGTRFAAGMSPSNLTAQGAWDQVDLAWDESFNSELGIVVERGTNSAFTGDVFRWVVEGNSTTGTVDTAPVTGMTSYYRVAATNSAGLSAWSDVASTVATASVAVITQATLSASSIFDLTEETQKMTLRGTRAAQSFTAWIAGVQVPLADTNPFHDYGAPTNSNWYIDPYGSSGYTLFRESYLWLFDFGNGVVTNLELVPVYLNFGSSWDNRLLLNLGYTGEISIDGTDYIVDVVQGASPEFKDRLEYPGYFNGPAVNVLLYDKATTNRIPSIGRMKFINGIWYSFDSNASGEQLTVSRMDGMGTLVLDAGPFQSNDLAFISGDITHERGWTLSLPDLTFSNATTVLPSGKYEFSECTVSNAGRTYTFVYHPSILNPVGCIDVPPDGIDVLTIGQNYELRVWLKNYKDPNRLLDYLWMDTQLIDTDMGAAVVPEQSEWMSVIECRNSTGGVVVCQWELPHGCGWNGAYLFVDETRIGADGSPFALPVDYHPPAVYDTRYLRVGANMTGLYGPVFTNVPFNVVNERKGFRARYYDFDAPLAAFPDFDNLLPALEKLETNPPPASAVTTPWTGLPPEMADTFGVRYDFDFFQQKSIYKAPATNYNVYVKCQGAARVYWDDELIVENVSHDAVTEVSAPLSSPVALESYHRVRIEYFHNEGPSMLEVRLSGTILIVISPPYPLPVNNYLRPGELWNVAPAHVPTTLSVTGPAVTAYTAPASFTVSAGAQHPDGIGALEVFVDDVKVAGGTNSPDAFLLEHVPVNALVAVRASDVVGYGASSNVDVQVSREDLSSWLGRHGLSDPDADDDGDEVANRDEYDAGTSPTNAASYFAVTDVDPHGPSNCVRWVGSDDAIAMARHELWVSTDLAATNPPGGWIPAGPVVPVGSTSGVCSVWHTPGTNAPAHYRVRVVPR